MAAGGFSITIRAIDDATATINKINKRIASISQPVRDLGAATQRFARASGLSSIAKDFGGIGSAAVSGLGMAAGGLLALAGVAATFSAGSLLHLVTGWASFGQELLNTSSALGMSVESLSDLEIAARLAGRSSGEMDSSLASLRSTMQNAIYGSDPMAVAVFNHLGIAFGNVHTGARDVMSVLPQIADEVQRLYKINPENAQDFLDIMHISRSLLPVLKDGRTGLEKYLAAAARLRPLSQATAEDAARVNESNTALALTFERLGYSIAAALGPSFMTIMDTVRDFVQSHMGDIQDAMNRFAVWLKTNLTVENMNKISHAIESVVTWIGHLIDKLVTFSGMGVAEIFASAFGVDPDGWLMRLVRILDIQVGGSRPASAAPTSTGPNSAEGPIAPRGVMGQIGNILSGRPPANDGNNLPLLPQGAPDAPGGSRGVRNHNLTNLGLVRGDAGLIGTDGREGIYRDDAAGIAGAERNLLRYRARGLTTLSQIIGEWSPPGENDTPTLIANAARRTGWSANAPVDVRDPAQAERLMSALIAQEVGRRVETDVLRRGVASGLGLPDPTRPATPVIAPVAGAPPVAPVPGGPDAQPVQPPGTGPAGPHQLDIRLDGRNMPPGVVVTPVPRSPNLVVNPSPLPVPAAPRTVMPMQLPGAPAG